MKAINVLVSSAGSAPAVAVIKALAIQKHFKINIFAVDMDETSAGFYLENVSTYYTVPSSNDEDFIPKIKQICKSDNISIVIPIIDEELIIFAKAKKEFQDVGVKVLVNEPEVVERCKNKEKAAIFFKSQNITTATTGSALAINNSDFPLDLENEEMSFPIMLKPIYGRGSEGIEKCNTKEDFLFFKNNIKNKEEIIPQEFIEGTEYTVDIVASPEGEILQAIPRERIVIKAGMVYKGRTVKDRALMDTAKNIAKKTGITGPCNIQFIKKGDEFYVIEINPKFAAGLPLTVNAGVNIPLLLIRIQLEENYRPTESELDFKDSFYMMRYWEEKYLQK